MTSILRAGTLAAMMLSILFAGCAEDAPPPAKACGARAGAPPTEAGLITPGTWVVNGAPDHVLVWAHNPSSSKGTINWCMEFADGTGVPAAWELSAQTATVELQPNGTKVETRRGVDYPDWKWTLFTIKVPSGTPAGDHAMALDTGAGRHNFTLKILGARGLVSHPNDEVELRYDGKFHATGQRFDQGEFETRLGSGQTVPGFDYGLMGLAVNEDASLILPPALGYGYDNTDPSYTKFNGQTLRFDVKILRFL